jgi:hypothetical protein
MMSRFRTRVGDLHGLLPLRQQLKAMRRGSRLEPLLVPSRRVASPAGLNLGRLAHKYHSHLPVANPFGVKVGRQMIPGVEPELESGQSDAPDIGHGSIYHEPAISQQSRTKVRLGLGRNCPPLSDPASVKQPRRPTTTIRQLPDNADDVGGEACVAGHDGVLTHEGLGRSSHANDSANSWAIPSSDAAHCSSEITGA